MYKAFLFLGILSATSVFGQVLPTEANLRAGVLAGGTLQFSASGAIALTTPVVVASDVTIDGNGNTVTLDGGNLTSIFTVNSGVRLTLKNLTIANGTDQGVNATAMGQNGGNASGGAIKNNGGDILLSNCVFTNNSARGGAAFVPFPNAAAFNHTRGGAAAGGAVWQSGGSLTVENSFFDSNRAIAGVGPGVSTTVIESSGFGGAIFAQSGSITISNTTFNLNTSVGSGSVVASSMGGGPAAGGAIFLANGSLSINNSILSSNTTYAGANSEGAGGAISIRQGSLVLTNTHVFRNSASGGSGAMYGNNAFASGFPSFGGALYIGTNVTANVSSSALIENVSTGGTHGFGGSQPHGISYGGALYNAGSLTVLNTTLSGNVAFKILPPNMFDIVQGSSEGGAIFNQGSAGLTNVTVVSNSSVFAVLRSSVGAMTLKNSLLANNTSSTELEFTDAGHNLNADAGPILTAASSQTGVDLKLGPLDNYGGPTPTYPLLAGSPAINAADDAAAPAIDQRGRARPFGAHADVGAFESSPPYALFGKMHGSHPNASANIGANSTLADASGNFLLKNVAQGANSLQLTADNTYFRPNPINLDVQYDMTTEARGFAYDHLAFDPDVPEPSFTFAGHASQTWEFQISGNLEDWVPVHTNTFTTDNVFTMPLTGIPSPVFMKGILK